MRRLAALIGVLVAASCGPAFAHDWYSGKTTGLDHPTHPGWSCCNGDEVNGDCKPVSAWLDDSGRWVFRYVDGSIWSVPDYALRPDEENEQPFQASACVYKGTLMCFWRKASGI